ncbi:MAG: enoyl-CoA hydratase/isomerase family protein, partial [Myxococcales bacterium]|nr:enoyl-CoA hydratase/isomerase family protein [Myxococcales bacterium]
MSDLEHGVTVERHGAVAVWTLDRPDRMNALGRATVRELGRLAREARTDTSIRAVVLTGRGDKAFCAGADLKERKTMPADRVPHFVKNIRGLMDDVAALPQPTVAVINGFAFGGG